jgi:uncharacterized protein (DUF305 family)
MTTAQTSRHGRRLPLIIAAIAAAVLVFLAGWALGRLVPSGEITPTTTSAEAGFARDMQVHHRQAVEMSLIIRDQTQDETIRQLAYDIATSQQHQAGQMYGWLAVWGLPQASQSPAMDWMMTSPEDSHEAHGGMAHASGQMPGMATTEELRQLQTLNGTEAERLFLELMIDHHRGGVDMANAVLERSDSRVVEALANSVVFAQESEIDYMTELLAQR